MQARVILKERSEEEKGLILFLSHEIVKNCLVRIVTDSDISWKIFVHKELRVILG